jgi:hypothetical protein
LNAADEIVDEFHQAAAAHGAKVNRIATQHREYGPRRLESFGRAAYQEYQFAGCGMRFRAGDRRIKELAAALGRTGGEFANPISA